MPPEHDADVEADGASLRYAAPIVVKGTAFIEVHVQDDHVGTQAVRLLVDGGLLETRTGGDGAFCSSGTRRPRARGGGTS